MNMKGTVFVAPMFIGSGLQQTTRGYIMKIPCVTTEQPTSH